MKTKKTKSANLENKKTIFFLFGMCISLALVFTAFSWGTPENDTKQLGTASLDSEWEEDIVITKRDKPQPKPKPEKPKPEKVKKELKIIKNSNEKDDVDKIDWEGKNKNPVVIFDPEPEEKEKTEVIKFAAVEKKPVYPGGMKELLRYVSNETNYPAIARENNIDGKVFVEFIINKEGKVVNAKLVRGVDPSLNKESLRVVESMPDWKPGKQAGKNVSVRYVMPISFVLE